MSIKRIREDSSEARPIIQEIERIVKLGEDRHKDICADLVFLIHPSDLLTTEEKERVHELKLLLRPKSVEEAREDILKKRKLKKNP